MAVGVLAADGIPNLPEDDDQGEKGSSHPAAAHTPRSDGAPLIVRGACFRHQRSPDGWGWLRVE